LRQPGLQVCARPTPRPGMVFERDVGPVASGWLRTARLLAIFAEFFATLSATNSLNLTMMRESGFASYSHKEKKWLEEFVAHFKVFERGMQINV
jgi:hypothetical protein